MTWGDLITIACVLLALWTFLPRPVRRALQSGLWPAIAALLDMLHDAAIMARKVLTVIAYRGLLGVPVPTQIIVKSEIADDENTDVAQPATNPQHNNNRIATPATDSNALLFQQRAADLALVVKAGKMGETEGIKLFFGVSPSSSNPRYLAARAALKDELAKLDPPKYPQMTPEQQQLREQLQLTKR